MLQFFSKLENQFIKCFSRVQIYAITLLPPSSDYSLLFTQFIRSTHTQVSVGKDVLQIWSKLTRQLPCRSVILVTFHSNIIEITPGHGYSPVNYCIFPEHLFLRIPLDGCFWFMYLHGNQTSSNLIC